MFGCLLEDDRLGLLRQTAALSHGHQCKVLAELDSIHCLVESLCGKLSAQAAPDLIPGGIVLPGLFLSTSISFQSL